MKHLTLILVAFAVIVFQSCSSEAEDDKILMVKANGKVSVQANEASFSFTANCIDKDILKSKACLLEQSEAFNAMLIEQGVISTDITTTSITQNKEYEWKRSGRVFKGYRSSITTRVKVGDIEVLEQVYGVLLTNEKISLGALQYSHSALDSLEQQAYINALESAGNLADKLLAQMDENDKEIRTVKNVDLPTSIQFRSKFMEADNNYSSETSSLQINQSTIEINRQLIVEYEIE